jgi:hypothetical protein
MNQENYNPKDIKFGLIAVNPTQEGDMLDVLHFCGYWNQPTLVDVDSLREELKSDPDFGLTDIADRLDIIPAPDWLVQEYVEGMSED